MEREKAFKQTVCYRYLGEMNIKTKNDFTSFMATPNYCSEKLVHPPSSNVGYSISKCNIAQKDFCKDLDFKDEVFTTEGNAIIDPVTGAWTPTGPLKDALDQAMSAVCDLYLDNNRAIIPSKDQLQGIDCVSIKPFAPNITQDSATLMCNIAKRECIPKK